MIAGIAAATFFVGGIALTSWGVPSKSRAEYFEKTGVYNGWKITASRDLERRILTLRDTTISPGLLKAIDNEPAGVSDGRFDTIDLCGLPNGHPLERYANPDSLEAAYAFASAQRPGGLK